MATTTTPDTEFDFDGPDDEISDDEEIDEDEPPAKKATAASKTEHLAVAIRAAALKIEGTAKVRFTVESSEFFHAVAALVLGRSELRSLDYVETKALAGLMARRLARFEATPAMRALGAGR